MPLSLVAALLVLQVGGVPAAAPSSSTEALEPLAPFPAALRRPGVPIAHRGLLRFAPENSLLAMDIALDRGFRFLEIDVAATRDNRFIVFHDATLERIGNPASPCALDTPALAGVSLAPLLFDDAFAAPLAKATRILELEDPWLDALRETRIPLLEDVFGRFGKRTYYHLDLKQVACGPDQIPMTRALLDLIRRFGLERHTFIEAEDAGQLALIKALAPDQAVIFWKDDIDRQSAETIALLRALKFNAVDVVAGRLREGGDARFDGIYLFTYTINSPPRFEALRRRFDYLVTDLDAATETPADRYDYFNQRSTRVKILPGAADPRAQAFLAQGYAPAATGFAEPLVLLRSR